MNALLELFGLAAVVAGITLFSPALGLIAAGAALLWLSWGTK